MQAEGRDWDVSRTEAQAPVNEVNRESEATAHRRGRNKTQAAAKGQEQRKEGAVREARGGGEVTNDKRRKVPAFDHKELAVACKHILRRSQ